MRDRNDAEGVSPRLRVYTIQGVRGLSAGTRAVCGDLAGVDE
jgi:hypothetical protein